MANSSHKIPVDAMNAFLKSSNEFFYLGSKLTDPEPDDTDMVSKHIPQALSVSEALIETAPGVVLVDGIGRAELLGIMKTVARFANPSESLLFGIKGLFDENAETDLPELLRELEELRALCDEVPAVLCGVLRSSREMPVIEALVRERRLVLAVRGASAAVPDLQGVLDGEPLVVVDALQSDQGAEPNRLVQKLNHFRPLTADEDDGALLYLTGRQQNILDIVNALSMERRQTLCLTNAPPHVQMGIVRLVIKLMNLGAYRELYREPVFLKLESLTRHMQQQFFSEFREDLNVLEKLQETLNVVILVEEYDARRSGGEMDGFLNAIAGINQDFSPTYESLFGRYHMLFTSRYADHSTIKEDLRDAQPIILRELGDEDVRAFVSGHAERLAEIEQIEISSQMVSTIIDMGRVYIHSDPPPTNMIRLLHAAAQQAGRTQRSRSRLETVLFGKRKSTQPPVEKPVLGLTHVYRALQEITKLPLTDDMVEAKSFAGSDPSKTCAYLDRFVAGHRDAKQQLAVALKNHILRVMYADVPKSNVLLAGPTGTGKSYLIQRISEYIGVPFVKYNCKGLTETGYVGKDVDDILRILLAKCQYDIDRAAFSIIYLDEFDKIRTERAGGQRDVAGLGVQQLLLKLLGGEVIPVRPTLLGNEFGRTYDVDCSRMLVVCAGAFHELFNAQDDLSFGLDAYLHHGRFAKRDSLLSRQDIIDYGFIPELIGRIGTIAVLASLNKDDIVSIMRDREDSLVSHYRRRFKYEGRSLTIQADAYEPIADYVLSLGMGARGIQDAMEKLLFSYMFDDHAKKIVITPKKVRETLHRPEKDSLLA